ncbi:MAG TPA: phage tail protein [Anaerolineae bacterium]|nr:phage tail protein [Anaerolineaceae bacterium]HRV96186.1 phage tail protein [Anaerolineae bacterium]
MSKKRADPLADFRFELKIEGIAVGWFTECSGLTIEREVMPHPEGGVNNYLHQLPGRIKRQSLTLKRGVGDEALWQWLQTGRYDGQVKRLNASVILYQADRTELGRWNFSEVYPTRWSGAELRAGSQRVTLETLELSQGSGDSATGSIQRLAIEPAALPDATSIPTVDLPKLADKIYALFKQDLRLEQERAGRHRW